MLSSYPLHIPRLDDALTKELLDYINSFELDQAYDPKITLSDNDWLAFHTFFDQTKAQCSFYKAFGLPVNFQERIKLELASSIFSFDDSEIYVQYITDGEVVSPHRDEGRTLNLIYNLTGDNSITEFYDKKINDEHRYVFHLEELEGPIEVHCFQPNVWYVFNNQKVHSVKNFKKVRAALSVSINTSYEQFLDFYTSKNLINFDYKSIS